MPQTFHTTASRLCAALFAAAIALGAPLAHAGSAADAAKAHIDAIAQGNEAAINAAYATDAVLEWVGGPLDGRYTTSTSIAGVWSKFGKANPNLKAHVSKLTEAANPKGATVTADVIFEGKGKIPVRYVLTYRDQRLVEEIWQVDPALAAKSKY